MKYLDLTGTLDVSTVETLLKSAKETNTSLYYLITLGNLLKLFKEETIVPYENNRSGNMNRGRIKDMAGNFRPCGFGHRYGSASEPGVEQHP